MGEYADLFIEGFLDEETGEIIDGDSPGYPRSPSRENRKAKAAKKLKCPHCPRKFSTQNAVEMHVKDIHESDRLLLSQILGMPSNSTFGEMFEQVKRIRAKCVHRNESQDVVCQTDGKPEASQR